MEQVSLALEGIVEKEIGRMMLDYANNLSLDLPEIIQSQTVEIVEQIATLIQKAEAHCDDQQLVEDILEILHKHGISTGVCHDY